MSLGQAHQVLILAQWLIPEVGVGLGHRLQQLHRFLTLHKLSIIRLQDLHQAGLGHP